VITEEEIEDPQMQPTVISKEATFALETSRKYIVGNVGDLFKPLGCLENIIEKNDVLNKHKQLILHYTNSLKIIILF